MTRLSKDEIRSLRERLSQWQEPEEMERLIDQVPSRVFFNQPGLQFLRDAWTAATFARLRSCSAVKLVAGEWPDFELRVGKCLEQFEVVEALDPKRRRGREFSDPDPKPRSVPMEKWIADAGAAPSWVAEVCRRKVEKRYSQRSSLLVYLNFSEFGIRQQEVRAALPSATSVAADCFNSIWVLWQQNALQIWNAGAPSEVCAPPARP